MSVSNTPGREEISLYDSALENLTFSSINESGSDANDNSMLMDTTYGSLKDTTDADITLNNILSENSDNVEVDPKSKLANRTVFKSDNPNLSIIEINSTSAKDDESIVYLIESDDEENALVKPNKKSPNSSRNRINADDISAKSSPSASKITKNSFENRNEAIKNNGEKLKSPRIIKVYDTIEEFDKNLPPTVTRLETPYGSKVYLVGTAHFSEESQDDVSLVIRNVRPDIVMVELCQSRIHILKHDEKTLLEEAKNINLAMVRNIINTNGFVNGVFYILLLHMSAQLAKELGMAPGGEFRRALEEVHKLPGCLLHLGDRPINITLQRALRALSLWQTLKLVWRLTFTPNISIEEVEECKQRDLLEKLMQEMAGEFPAFSDVFVKERDLYLCHSLQVTALPLTQQHGPPRPVKVVGVIGIGHVAGIAKNWGKVDPAKIPEILVIPPISTSTKLFKYTIKYGFIGLTVYGLFKLIRPRLRGVF